VAYLLRLLTRRDYAEAELDERLRRKGAPDEVRAAALERLRELELIDDARVADALVRAGARRKGRLALRRDLRARGVDDATVDAALRPLDDEQQAGAARAVLRKEAWRFASGDPRKDRAKAAGFLRRRGFDGDAVGSALEATFDDDPSDPDDAGPHAPATDPEDA
jgi:regulatory protein